MTDAILRRPKEAILTPIARRTPRRVHPLGLTMAGLVPGLGAALAAATGHSFLAVGLWLLNRLIDGLDGTLARQQGRQSDLGGYIDLLADFVVYAAVPVGLAVHHDSRAAWVAVCVLLASFYVNTISWSYLSAIAERRRAMAADRLTSIELPGGLVEGAETVVFFTAMLLLPTWTPVLCWVMAVAVAVTILQRLAWAVRAL